MKRDKVVWLDNPWSNSSKESTWGWVKDWASEHIHPSDLADWLKEAGQAVKDGHWGKLGAMVIGS